MIIRIKKMMYEDESMSYMNYSLIDELTNNIFYCINIPKELKVREGDFVQIKDDKVIRILDKYEIEKTLPELLL
jgi:hypothetical protein